MDVSDLFIYKNTVWKKEDCDFAISTFNQYREEKNRLVLFFGMPEFKDDLTEIKKRVDKIIQQEILLYLARENVDILDNGFTFYNMCIRSLVKTEKHFGKIVFKNENEIHSYIKFVFCLQGTVNITVLNKDVQLEPGQMVLFPSSWVFPYQYNFKDDCPIFMEGFLHKTLIKK